MSHDTFLLPECKKIVVIKIPSRYDDSQESPIILRPMSDFIVFSAGGTGGHIFPALAVAKALTHILPSYKIHFITDKKASDPSVVWKQFLLPRKNSKATFPLFILMMAIQTIVHMAKFLYHRPKLVVGFGGYACVPVVFAAQLLGIQTILHEQNAYLGRAHRILKNKASMIALSFEKTEALPKGIKTILTGNPVRFEKIPDYKAQKNRFHLFIFGGSQGAHSFSTLIPEAIALLPQNLHKHISVTHQSRPEDMEATQERYKNLGIQANLSSFFKDMETEYSNADIVIARSGASTVSEISTAGRCSILIPYPFAMDDHQYYNAKALGNTCYLFRQRDITPQNLSSLLQELLENPSLREEKAKAIQKYSMAKASSHFATVLKEFLMPPPSKA